MSEYTYDNVEYTRAGMHVHTLNYKFNDTKIEIANNVLCSLKQQIVKRAFYEIVETYNIYILSTLSLQLFTIFFTITSRGIKKFS